jgi:hypothetical protein
VGGYGKKNSGEKEGRGLISNPLYPLKKQAKRPQSIEHYSLEAWSPSDISVY